MRLLPVLVTLTCLTATGCIFDSSGLSGSGGSGVSTGEEPTTSDSGVAPTTGGTGTTGFCGDGNTDKELGEECDAGPGKNGFEGSVCKSDCILNVCGDEYKSAQEQCDDGNDDPDDGCHECKLTKCGDGKLDEGEECDDGNKVDDDGCNSACQTPFCGNKLIDQGEDCDDGRDNGSGQPCKADCSNQECGDGVVDPGEACDGGDLCDNMCNQLTCGDGIKQREEECDASAGDENCSEQCLFLPVCGDGKIDDGETCDDGEANSDTGKCTTNCTLTNCGDGTVQSPNGEDIMEECDDGAENNGPDKKCTAECKKTTCGDNEIQSPNGNDENEECDDGPMNGPENFCNANCERARYAFVSDERFNGNLGGRTGASEKCQDMADEAMLPGTYHAWLGGSTNNQHAKTYVNLDSRPYFLPGDSKIKIAQNGNGVISGSLMAPINRDQFGAEIIVGMDFDCQEDSEFAWTNAKPDGDVNDGQQSCDGWTSNANNKDGGRGCPRKNDGEWTLSCQPFNCAAELHIYCFEHVP